MRPVGRNDDVDGSKCGTMLRGIVTMRQTNPLIPKYQVPGNSKDGQGVEVNNPYANKAVRKDNAMTKSVHFQGGSKLVETGMAAMASSKSTAQKLDQFVN